MSVCALNQTQKAIALIMRRLLQILNLTFSCKGQGRMFVHQIQAYVCMCTELKYEGYSLNNEKVITDLKFDLKS